ncbi:hypothetical protein BABINDRAFT_160843 [Babjeviella inositovora NRRL Y-12698]|uniref:SCA7 domain-containing protein n=1 Tax=Babjeviella inositovora NRRL Y-12698 TaxID=984486 RepID=A0A1E3QSB9_9ASCO|nr:uncharacterized protein BABINDRAFT_160843 [Babjeviella inositovora NRRL Y-12698]ODQ80581.1 hypothetical protein BABINDRAFT_160843 [Babjeviella inositovora NRRL Y-12698]
MSSEYMGYQQVGLRPLLGDMSMDAIDHCVYTIIRKSNKAFTAKSDPIDKKKKFPSKKSLTKLMIPNYRNKKLDVSDFADDGTLDFLCRVTTTRHTACKRKLNCRIHPLEEKMKVKRSKGWDELWARFVIIFLGKGKFDPHQLDSAIIPVDKESDDGGEKSSEVETQTSTAIFQEEFRPSKGSQKRRSRQTGESHTSWKKTKLNPITNQARMDELYHKVADRLAGGIHPLTYSNTSPSSPYPPALTDDDGSESDSSIPELASTYSLGHLGKRSRSNSFSKIQDSVDPPVYDLLLTPATSHANIFSFTTRTDGFKSDYQFIPPTSNLMINAHQHPSWAAYDDIDDSFNTGITCVDEEDESFHLMADFQHNRYDAACYDYLGDGNVMSSGDYGYGNEEFPILLMGMQDATDLSKSQTAPEEALAGGRRTAEESDTRNFGIPSSAVLESIFEENEEVRNHGKVMLSRSSAPCLNIESESGECGFYLSDIMDETSLESKMEITRGCAVRPTLESCHPDQSPLAQCLDIPCSKFTVEHEVNMTKSSLAAPMTVFSSSALTSPLHPKSYHTSSEAAILSRDMSFRGISFPLLGGEYQPREGMYPVSLPGNLRKHSHALNGPFYKNVVTSSGGIPKYFLPPTSIPLVEESLAPITSGRGVEEGITGIAEMQHYPSMTQSAIILKRLAMNMGDTTCIPFAMFYIKDKLSEWEEHDYNVDDEDAKLKVLGLLS